MIDKKQLTIDTMNAFEAGFKLGRESNNNHNWKCKCEDGKLIWEVA